MNSEHCGTATAVGVRVPADHRHLLMLRGLTETALLLAEFGLDEVTDLQVAIDEVATGLVDVAIDGSTIDCDLAVDAGWITVCISAMAVTREIIDEQGFAWHVIRTVAETPTADVGSYDRIRGGYPVTVEFGRRSGSFAR
ncbi:anti-sigma factor [Nocardia sp. NPDC052254]|uniref:anti-sigma factor n=1 Tax=Nocardia sp. NPDC052254 TaxID=3155681 RepID=UPI0034173FD8